MTTKEGGLRGSIRNVGVGVSTIPDSAVASYDATQEASTGDITTITDRVGSFDLTGSATVVSNSINGEQAYDFDDTEEMGETAMSVSTEPFAVVIVFRSDVATDLHRPFGTVNTEDHFRLILQYANDYYSVRRDSTDVDGGSPDTDLHVVTVKGYSTDQILLRVDGSDVVSGTSGTGFIDGFALSPDSFDQFFDGVIGAATVLENTSDADISQEEQRLADKFGATIA